MRKKFFFRGHAGFLGEKVLGKYKKFYCFTLVSTHPCIRGFSENTRGFFVNIIFRFFTPGKSWCTRSFQFPLLQDDEMQFFCNQDVVFRLDDLNEDHSPLEFIFSRNQDCVVYYNLCFNEDTQRLSITYVLMRRSSFLKVACVVKIKLFFCGLILL